MLHNNREEILQEITERKREGRETGTLVARLIEIDKKPKPNKKPKINTP
jgi:hypothetical protein